jgi:exopolyphosphatase/guanosine-5'-triphosphate,3'-diphosphate pyrophosphatase
VSDLIAAVDCGTNSVRLLVCRRDSGRLVELDRRLHLTRLGQGVDATGHFDPDALARTLAALADFGRQLEGLGVPLAHRRVVATSAARDAADAEDFFVGVRDRLGVEAEVIAGEEEARLSYLGATSALPELAQPVLVMDIGGGSTEPIAGRDGRPLQAVSLDVGAVRVRERFLHSDPPSAAQLGAAREHVHTLLDGCGVDLAAAATWVGVGGTATSLSALAQGLSAYDRSLVHGSVVGRQQLDALTTRLLAARIAEVAALPTMQPGRADVICAGALICAAVAERVAGPLVVSEADLLDGIVLGLSA